jgi:hypothetical protein
MMKLAVLILPLLLGGCLDALLAVSIAGPELVNAALWATEPEPPPKK